jgi:rhamnose transport system substrate-binding protein
LPAFATASAEECAKAPVTVGFLPKLDTDPYFQVAQTGAEEAAAEIGGKAIKQAPSQATAEAQIDFINNLVSQKVGVIAISANDANAVAPALRVPKSRASRSSPMTPTSRRTPARCSSTRRPATALPR